jgi:2-oxoglutarate dehydrogenase complex dehydrogenase (E1) component-like enzyme
VPLQSVRALLLGADAARHAFDLHGSVEHADRYLALLHGPSTTTAAAAGSSASSSARKTAARKAPQAAAADPTPPKSCALEFASAWAKGRFLRCVRRLGQQEGHAPFFAVSPPAQPQANELIQDAPDTETQF